MKVVNGVSKFFIWFRVSDEMSFERSRLVNLTYILKKYFFFNPT